MEEYEGGFLQSSPKHEYTGVKTIRNLTAKQIQSYESTDSSTSIHIIDQAEVSTVQVCGYVTAKKTTSAGIIFEINDTTATTECVFWANGSFDEIVSERIQENSLLLITGSLKVFNHKKTINCSCIRIVNSNYLIFHLVNALYQHLFFNNCIPRETIKEKSTGMPRIHNDILEVYRNNQDEDGLEINTVVSMLKDKYKENDIRASIEQLLSDCHLYSVEGTCYRTSI